MTENPLQKQTSRVDMLAEAAWLEVVEELEKEGLPFVALGNGKFIAGKENILAQLRRSK